MYIYIYIDRVYIYRVYIYPPVSGCEAASTVFVLSSSNELVTWGGFLALLLVAPVKTIYTP